MNALPPRTAAAGIPGRMRFRESLLFAVIGAILFSGVEFERPAALSNDSYQYLSVAASVANGTGIETPLVHFDSERSSGLMPAPMTTFAPGFPVAVALSSFLAGAAERGARLISIAASALSVLLIWALANFAGLDRASTRVGMALLLCNAFFLHASTAVATEPLFLLVSLLGLLVLAFSIEGLPGERARWKGLATGQILVAASYSIRYAGVFVFAAVVVHAAMVWVLSRNRRSLLYLLSNAISGALIGSIMIRNLVLVGSWKGGNEKHVSNTMPAVLGDYVRAQFHLLFGMHITDAWVISIAVLSAIAVFRGATTLLRNSPHMAPLLSSGGLLFVYGAVSTASLIYLGKTSVIGFGPRMFYPLLPLYIIGALAMVQRGWAPAVSGRVPAHYRRGFALLFVALYGWVNLREFDTPREHSLVEDFRGSFGKPMENGQPIGAWIDANIGPNEAIAADSGQATGYFLKRPVLSLIESHYSTIAWDRETLSRQMRRFHARFLILNLTMTAEADPVRTESEFLANAICCRANPGFHVVAENPDIRILEINDR